MSIFVASTGDLSLMPYTERCDLAEGHSTPPETLAELAKDEEWVVRWCVARNTSAPPETLAMLAEYEDSGLRCHLARNRNTPPETLAMLAKDEYKYVRWFAKDNLDERAAA